jgi:hypothetical protein
MKWLRALFAPEPVSEWTLVGGRWSLVDEQGRIEGVVTDRHNGTWAAHCGPHLVGRYISLEAAQKGVREWLKEANTYYD